MASQEPAEAAVLARDSSYELVRPGLPTAGVRQTVSLQGSGLDGVFYDNLREEPEPWVSFLKEVRQPVGDHFLILANCGYSVGKHDFAAPFLNGFMYESGWSHNRTEWTDVISQNAAFGVAAAISARLA